MTESSSNKWIRIAALQPALEFGKTMPNLHLIRSTVEQIADEAPLDILVLPEIFDGNPEPSNGHDARKFLANLARSCKTHVIGGSVLLREGDGRPFNTCFVVNRDGNEVGRYDKRIMFSVESDIRQPGRSAGVFTLDDFRVGVLICADLWHPELAREMIGRIDLLVVPAKTSVPTREQIPYAERNWKAMALTRAMENGFAVVVADWPNARHDWERRTDDTRTRQTHYTAGVTCIVDPSYRPDIERIEKSIAGGTPGVLRADINLEKLAAYRAYRSGVGLLPKTADGPRNA